jgi:hypothetical protein
MGSKVSRFAAGNPEPVNAYDISTFLDWKPKACPYDAEYLHT